MWSPWTASRSRSGAARCSGSWGPTAPARPRPWSARSVCAAGRRPGAGVRAGPGRGRDEVRQRVGVQLQHAALPDRMKVSEALAVFASAYRRPADPAALLREWGLPSTGGKAFKALSGGQRQRLFIALALLGRPGAGGPGRADHRPGSGGATGHLGAGPPAAGGRRHGAAGHPRDGRGGAALRPARGDRPRPGGRRGHPGRRSAAGTAPGGRVPRSDRAGTGRSR